MKFKPHSRFALPFCIFPMLIAGVYRNFPKQNTRYSYIFPKICIERQLTSMVIKCCRIVDEYFFLGIVKLSNTEIFDLIKGYPEFTKIIKCQKTLKRERQMRRWLEIHFPYLGPDRIDNIATIANH